MEGPLTRLTQRKTPPVKYTKKRAKRFVAVTLEDMERIRRNSILEATHKASRENNRNYNF